MTDVGAAEPSGEGLGEKARPFVVGRLRFPAAARWAWQVFKVTIFLKGAFVGSSEVPCWGRLSFPPQGKSSPLSACECFLRQPWLSGDHQSFGILDRTYKWLLASSLLLGPHLVQDKLVPVHVPVLM